MCEKIDKMCYLKKMIFGNNFEKRAVKNLVAKQ